MPVSACEAGPLIFTRTAALLPTTVAFVVEIVATRPRR